MNKIPITLLFFTSTKGHFGHKEIYLDTLNHLARQIPLDSFSRKIAHIKITPGEEKQAETMMKELESRGFMGVATVADWSRGTVHQQEYMRDLIKISKNNAVYNNEHVLWLEDDSPFEYHKTSIEAGLARSVMMLKSDINLLSVRFLRRNDLHDSPIIKQNEEFFYSPHFNFQPAIMRSRDFYLICKMIEDNFDKILNVQSEMLWRLLFAQITRSELCHVVWQPDFGETYHLGCPEYPTLKEKLKL